MIGIYIVSVSSPNEEYIKSFGVMKKILAQVKVLNSVFGTKLDVINTYNPKPLSAWDKLKIRLPFFPIGYKWQCKEEYLKADFIYMRKPPIDCSLVGLFKKIKRHNPKCKIIFEIPTYPYIPEIMKNGIIKELPFIMKDFFNHNRLYKYVDLITTYSPDTKIWGIPALPLKNGVDFSSIVMPARHTKENTIELIEVSCPNFWHGYDRFIVGMGEYYKGGGTRNLIFHMVGDGMTVPQYRQLVKQYNLEEHVIIYGNKSGKELDQIYERAFIGLDGLARHRSGNTTNSSLKSREYAAYGIPFITSVDIDFADKDWPYIMTVPQDDSLINMKDVIKFYDSIYGNNDCNKIASDIRNYAKARCDMKITMQPVIEYIQK